MCALTLRLKPMESEPAFDQVLRSFRGLNINVGTGIGKYLKDVR